MWQRRRASALIPEKHTVRSTVQNDQAAPEREQKMAALGYVHEAWAEARLDGLDDDCMAMACLFAAFAELVTTYGEEAAATYADSLSKRIKNGEFTIEVARQ
jgi:predicted YcjX-like family ATPase